MLNYTCPVCGYNELTAPADDWEICPCCRTQFRYTDANTSHDELRRRWIAAGAPWGSLLVPPPVAWSPLGQLRNINYQVTEMDLAQLASRQAITSGKIEFENDDVIFLKLGQNGQHTITFQSNFLSSIRNLFSPSISRNVPTHA